MDFRALARPFISERVGNEAVRRGGLLSVNQVQTSKSELLDQMDFDLLVRCLSIHLT